MKSRPWLATILFACLLFSQAQAESQTNATVRVAGLVLKWIRADKEANLRRVEPMIREALKDMDVLEILSYEEQLTEGAAHAGMSALMGVLARKR